MYKPQYRKWWLGLLISLSIQGPEVLVEKTPRLLVLKQEVQLRRKRGVRVKKWVVKTLKLGSWDNTFVFPREAMHIFSFFFLCASNSLKHTSKPSCKQIKLLR